MEKHTCGMDYCITVIPGGWVMCRRHWQMMPRKLRNALWTEYRIAMEVGPGPGLAVKRDAIEYLAERESAGR